MRKAQKQEILDCIATLHQAHEEIREALKEKNFTKVQNMASECQEFAISLGETIEALEGEGLAAVSYLEEYCETLYHTFEDVTNGHISENRAYKTLKKSLNQAENSIKNDIDVRLEIVFFPYKASMWDSLESIYLAAKEDPACDVYCVPIPYFNLNPDGSLGEMHYEGAEYPENIEITDWLSYSCEDRKPDAIYIHNPYDNWNRVTSVHPRYYSDNLKKYTECLIYVPYYSTTGGMSKAQKLLPAYFHADYIVMQAPMYRQYFDESIPDKKFLPFGSPKFDKIIRKCQNPPKAPDKWREKMTKANGSRRKVYFYNTSLNGMLADTDAFLKKMRYVFDIFQGRKDSCILWRPHPLFETTLDSMRPEFKPIYLKLKEYFVEQEIGILDETPDMTDAIAWSDAYIGDSGTSVTSLFGIVGKPLFILNNRIHHAPKEDSWKGEILPGGMFNVWEQDRFSIIQGNKLYVSEPFQYDYHYFCDLSETSYKEYSTVREINGRGYACPIHAQNILELDKNGVKRKILLKEEADIQRLSFAGSWKYEKYLLLIPKNYPALIRYDTEKEEITYIRENIEVFVNENERNEKIVGGSWICEGRLYITSPMDHRMYVLDIAAGKTEILTLPIKAKGGFCGLFEKDGAFWMLPYRGQTVVRWDPATGEIREYSGFPEGFSCERPGTHEVTDEYPLGGRAFIGSMLYFVPNWGNMCLKLDTETGEFSRWDIAIPDGASEENDGYFYTNGKYVLPWNPKNERKYRLFSWKNRKLYDLDIEKNEYQEIEIKYDKTELEEHTEGFRSYVVKSNYCYLENCFHSLEDFLEGNIKGEVHDADLQKRSYEEIAANGDGSCGQKTHAYIKRQIMRK